MRFYTQQHQYYCGIDLHARTMYLCIIDQTGTVLVHRNLPTEREALVRAIEPYREDLVIAVECIFTWYWIADLCAKLEIPFLLGHALYRMSDPRREEQKRQDRLTEDRGDGAWRDVPDGLCLSPGNALHPRSAAKADVSHAPAQ